MMMLEPDDLLGDVPGVTALGASMWVDGGADETADHENETDEEDDEEELSEDEWLTKILAAADKLPGLDLAALGYSTSELNPDARARNLVRATNLRGALHWAYEYVVDQLFDDVQTLRSGADDPEATWQLSALPPAYRPSYDALFAQRFLVITLDLGSSLAGGFSTPSCLAQELALKLLLDGVESLVEMLPALELPHDWHELASENLFANLNHEMLYLDNDVQDLAHWFEPYPEQTLNPYAANE